MFEHIYLLPLIISLWGAYRSRNYVFRALIFVLVLGVASIVTTSRHTASVVLWIKPYFPSIFDVLEIKELYSLVFTFLFLLIYFFHILLFHLIRRPRPNKLIDESASGYIKLIRFLAGLLVWWGLAVIVSTSIWSAISVDTATFPKGYLVFVQHTLNFIDLVVCFAPLDGLPGFILITP